MNPDKPEPLSTFAANCESVALLKMEDQTAFASLDEYSTQWKIFSRLAKALSDKWFEHQWMDLQAETAYFEQFSGWIKGQAMISRMKCDSSNQVQKEQPKIYYPPTRPQ